MPQTYDINDLPPRKPSPKPNSCKTNKKPSLISPVKVRETKIDLLRKEKESKKFEFQPESGKEQSVQTPHATQVFAQLTPTNNSLLRSYGGEKTELSPEQTRYLQYVAFRRKVSAIQGVKKKDLEEILHKHFPEFTAEPQGFMDFVMPNIDTEAVQAAVLSIDRLTLGVSSLRDTKLSHSVHLGPTTVATIDNVVSAANKATESIEGMNTILLILAVVIVMRPTTYREKILVGVVVVGFVASKSNLMDLWKNSSLCSWLSKPLENEAEPQSFSLDEMTTMIVGLLNTYVFFGSGTDLFSPTKLSKVINNISRTEIGVNSLIKTVHLLANYIYSSIDHYWKGNPWFVATGHSFIDEFMREASEILLLHEERKLLDLRSSLERVRACVLLGETVVVKIPGSHDTVGLRLQVNNCLSEMKRIKKLLLASNFDNAGLRSEPTGLLLCGPPGVGKSNSMQHFAHAVNALTLSEEEYALYKENPATAIFTRNAENVYWEGYKQSHNIVFMDDIGQARDIQGSPDNEIFNTIRGINIFDYPLHMADISAKGNTTFRSKFVMGNTNLRNFKFESITQPGAFLRRWDVVVDVIPKKEFCVDPDVPEWNRRFDKNKLPIFTKEDIPEDREDLYELIGDTSIFPEMCNYHLKKMNKSETGYVSVGKVLEFDDVVRMLHETHLRKERYHKQSLYNLESRLDEYREDQIEMEEVEPQTGSTSLQFQCLDYISRLKPEHRAYLNDLKVTKNDEFLILDTVMREIYSRSVELGGIFWFQESFDLVMAFFLKNGFQNDIWSTFGAASWVEFIGLFSQEIFMQTMHPREANRATKDFIKRIELSRTWLQQYTITRKTTPTWVSWLFRVYKYAFAHVCAFGGAISSIAQSALRDLANSRLFEKLLAVGAAALTFKAVMVIAPMIFPAKKKKNKKSFATALAQSEDPNIISARQDLVLAEIEFKKAQAEFEKRTALYKLQFIEQNESCDPESDERSNRSHKVRRVVRPPRAVVPQSLQKHNGNLVSVQRKIMTRNVFRFYSPSATEKDKHVHSGYALALHGRAIMLPYHFLSVIQAARDDEDCCVTGDSKVHLRRTIGDYLLITLTVDELFESFRTYEPGEAQDMVILKLPERCQPNPSCVRYFCSQDKIASYQKIDAMLSVPGPGEFFTELHPIIATSSTYQHVGGDEFDDYTVKEVFCYSTHTSPGDCGSLLYANDRSNPNCIIGMHVAGVTALKCGFAAAISREFIEDYLKFLGLEDVMPPEVDFVNPSLVAVPNMNCVGEVKPGIPYPRSIGRTRIVPSHLHGLISPVQKAPARLKPFFREGVRFDPNQLALSKYCHEDVFMSPKCLDYAKESLWLFLRRESKVVVEPEVYSYENAVLGDDSGFWSAVPRGTSSGYPWNCMPGPSSKVRFWGDSEKYDLANDSAVALKSRVEGIIRLAKKNMRVLHLYTDSLKDERRSMNKVEKGVTRMISCCPVDLLIAFRMYFGAFQKWLVANRIANGCAIGINEHSSEWDLLAQKLNRFGESAHNKGAGDHEGFDTKHRSYMSLAVLQMVKLFYKGCDKEDDNVRNVLWQEISNSFHLNEGLVYEWFTALPSGAPPTTMFNCMANQLLFRAAWFDIHARSPFTPSFDAHIYLCVLGDDNVFAVNAPYVSHYTETNLATLFKQYGYVYTPEDKTLAIHGTHLRELAAVSFLKRGFIKHAHFGRYVGPLELNSILDMLQWQKESSSSYSDCESLIQTALEELAFHPQEEFLKWQVAFETASKLVEGINVPLNSYQSFVSLLKKRDGEPGQIDFDGLLSDYGAILNTCLIQQESERFEKERGSFFKLTARTPRWQPQSSPGNQANSNRLVHRLVLQRTAETQSAGNTITDQAPPGQTVEGSFETSRKAPMISQQTSDTTKSTVDADTPLTEIQKYIPLHPNLLDSARTGVSQDVNAFLAKPIIIANGSFSTSDTYATFIYTSDGIPQSLLYTQPLWLNKLAGNFAFKGTLHLSLQVNGTRFQQGRYILGWVPSGGGTDPNKFRRMHTASLTLATQCPHVEVDVNCDSEASLIIPHITAQGWAALNSVNGALFGNNGSIFIAAYEPLAVSTGSLNATWSLFAHFEDIEYCMPAQPQSRAGAKTKVRRKVRAPFEAEQESQGLGPLSTGLTMVSQGAAVISGVPFLSSVAGPVSWATSLAAKVASAFGWSRPHNAAQTMMIQRFITPRFTNVDVADNSTVLGATDSNAIEELPGFAGTDLDEMSLSYLTSISSFYKRVLWTTSNVQGDALLTNEQLTPRAYVTTSTIAATSVYSLAPISYFSGFFSLYRGSIKFTFKLVKTEFHTGRLLVVFKPYENAAGFPAGSTFAGSAYEHREIIDVRMGNEFTLEFPYMSITPYRSITGGDSAYGIVYVYVLNTLECPANVPQSITILIEASAGKDFELAEPCDMSGRPTQVYTPQSGRNVCEIVSENIGNSSNSETDVPSRLCIGERVTSIRQLLKRFSHSTTDTTPAPGYAHVWNMYQIDMGFIDATGFTVASVTPDSMAFLAPCFALLRGGLRGKIVPQDTQNVRVMTMVVPYVTGTILPLASQVWTAVLTTVTANYLGPQKLRAIFDCSTTGGSEWQLPFFNRCAMAPICDLMSTKVAAPEGFDYITGGVVPRNRVLNVFSAVPSSGSPLVMRAASEDFSLGLFISVPPLTGYDASYIG